MDANCIQSVYLAGEVHGKWKEKVLSACSHINFLYPQAHGLPAPSEFTAWN